MTTGECDHRALILYIHTYRDDEHKVSPSVAHCIFIAWKIPHTKCTYEKLGKWLITRDWVVWASACTCVVCTWKIDQVAIAIRSGRSVIADSAADTGDRWCYNKNSLRFIVDRFSINHFKKIHVSKDWHTKTAHNPLSITRPLRALPQSASYFV